MKNLNNKKEGGHFDNELEARRAAQKLQNRW